MRSPWANSRWYGLARRLAPCCLLFVQVYARAQNLVPNPSFEEYEVCPYAISFVEGDRPTYWRSWYNTPDYFNACAGDLLDLDTLVDVPQNGWGYQSAHHGQAYVGAWALYPGDFREYVGVALSVPLEVGTAYQVSYWVSLAHAGSYFLTPGACNKHGALFAMASNAWEPSDGPAFAFRNYAHVFAQEIIIDTVGWTEINGVFVADSAYQYLVIGNFFDNANTDAMELPEGEPILPYYFIDDVCVTRLGEECLRAGVGDGGFPGEAHVEWSGFDDSGFLRWPGRLSFHAEVFDLAGRCVFIGQAAGQSVPLNARGWAPGMYVARLTSGEAGTTLKFMKP